MSELNKCSQCGAPAVEQVRGEMGPGDYKEVQKPNAKGRMVFDEDFYKKVVLDDDNKTDIRISCTQCDNAIGWNKVDAPGMPGVGIEYNRKLWNERNPA